MALTIQVRIVGTQYSSTADINGKVTEYVTLRLQAVQDPTMSPSPNIPNGGELQKTLTLADYTTGDYKTGTVIDFVG